MFLSMTRAPSDPVQGTYVGIFVSSWLGANAAPGIHQWDLRLKDFGTLLYVTTAQLPPKDCAKTLAVLLHWLYPLLHQYILHQTVDPAAVYSNLCANGVSKRNLLDIPYPDLDEFDILLDERLPADIHLQADCKGLGPSY